MNNDTKFTIILCTILLLFSGIMCYQIYDSCFKKIKVMPFDKIKINKCFYCDNFIVFKRKQYDDIGNCSTKCEEVNNFSNCWKRGERAVIIKTSDPNYQLFKLKYDFYNNNGENFNKFYKWYIKNTNQEFYKYVRIYKVIEDVPIYETRSRSVYYCNGLYARRYSTEYYSVIVGYEKKLVTKKDIVYINPNNSEYIKEKCDIIEYYFYLERHNLL